MSKRFMDKALSTASPSMGTPLANGSTISKRSRAIRDGRMDRSAVVCSCVKDKAIAIRDSLDPGFPSFIKFLLRSHVTKLFWVGLPGDFCKRHLPNDATVILEGEDGMQYDITFVVGRKQLRGGWKAFSQAHNLQEGDAVVFQLVHQYEFKVYIVRFNDLDHHVHEGQSDIEKSDEEDEYQKRKSLAEMTPSLGENLLNDYEEELPTASPSVASEGTPLANGSTSRKRSMAMHARSMNISAAVCLCVKEKAIALRDSLDTRLPSFIKFLLRSHVTHGFWMSLPMDFHRMHLPNDATIILEGEDSMRYKTNFLAGKGGLSGGWRGFALSHNLQEGDAIVFQLVKQYEFKVYIVRVSDLDHCAHEGGQPVTEKSGEDGCEKRKSPAEVTPRLGENFLEDYEGEGFYFASDSEDSPAENMEESKSLDPFEDLKSFKIVVNGCPVDPLISVSARIKYYELCLSRKSYLHGELLKKINHQLATGVILEIISIADAIRACCLSTSQSDIKEWATKLEGFRLLGMDVGFLLDRVEELLRLAVEYQESGEAKRYYETTKKEKHLDEEIASLERKMMELKEARATLQSEREVLEAHFLKQRLSFQDTAKMAW
ncbi:unnamed protein product [Cuscuta campestris]|uniref:TF-B3 domain-containing protein n=2 Tax=Cuscuta sect. Cleistogrammica TaxID=1824901 RepID=A0A484L894_9ASTE|nr:hypothetical protein DM860_015205 [Cuscuta australis]VFQ72526.1 unnamed protein product [Cuscuta campestris]